MPLPPISEPAQTEVPLPLPPEPPAVHRTPYMFPIALLTLAFMLGCNQSFDPRAPLEEQMVVFSILSTDRSTQFVTVNRNYMPAGYDPREFAEDTFVMDATVSIMGPASVISLSDTIIPRVDTSRYPFPIQAYYTAPFVPAYEAFYEVVAQSPSLKTATGSTLIPGKATLTIHSSTQAILRLPTNYTSEALVELMVGSGGRARGYVCRMFVYYDVLVGGQWVEERSEIPISSISGSYSVTDARYPVLVRRPESGAQTIFFRNGFYRAVVDYVTYTKHPVGGLIYKWVVFTYLQVDQNLYEYYNAMHQYRDPLTVRLDEPTYSTIQGGVGLVGSYAIDSLVYVLPEKFYGNH